MAPKNTRRQAVPRIRANTPIGILKAVVKLIRAEPLRYYQNDWIRTYAVWRRVSDDFDSPIEKIPLPPCGTVCCVAGWVAVGKRAIDETVSDLEYAVDAMSRAKSLLGLTRLQAERLFDGDAVLLQWKHEGRKGKKPQEGTKRYAEIGIRHIERFMRDEMGYTGPKL